MDSTPENEYKRIWQLQNILVQAVTKSCFTEVLEMEVYGFLVKTLSQTVSRLTDERKSQIYSNLEQRSKRKLLRRF